jgi:hypothetical protein
MCKIVSNLWKIYGRCVKYFHFLAVMALASHCIYRLALYLILNFNCIVHSLFFKKKGKVRSKGC